MSAPADSAEAPDRAEQMLARLAELDLAAAERAHARYMAAETTPEASETGRTYQAMARSLRQTLALKAKLKRDREQARRAAAAAPPAKVGGAAVAQRIGDLRTAGLRLAWAEAPDEETYDWHAQTLDEAITDEMFRDGFAAEPLDDHIARLALALGFDPAAIAAWRDLPDPPRPPQPVDDLDWRSSG